MLDHVWKQQNQLGICKNKNEIVIYRFCFKYRIWKPRQCPKIGTGLGLGVRPTKRSQPHTVPAKAHVFHLLFSDARQILLNENNKIKYNVIAH